MVHRDDKKCYFLISFQVTSEIFGITTKYYIDSTLTTPLSRELTLLLWSALSTGERRTKKEIY